MQEVMRFGKYKGKRLCETPRGYLRWLVQQEWLGESLRAAIRDVLGQEPIPEAVPPAPARKPIFDRSHLAADLDARIHAVVRDASYWRRVVADWVNDQTPAGNA